MRLSFALTANLERRPGSRAPALISITPSLISGTSISKSSTIISFAVRLKKICAPLGVDFTSLIKAGKFINVVQGLTIFIETKNIDESYTNIFLDDSTKQNSKMIYAKNGIIVDDGKRKVFKLFKGKVINNEESKINVFEFDQIDFNLADFASNTITVPKIQEIPSHELIGCFFPLL